MREVAEKLGVRPKTLSWWLWRLERERPAKHKGRKRKQEAPMFLPVVVREPQVERGLVSVEIGEVRLRIEAGADVIFVEAPRTVDELALVGRELRGVPLVVNVVEGGKTPELSLAEYRDLGFAVVLFANFLMRAMIRAGAEVLGHLRAAGETVSYSERIATWQERQSLFHLQEFSAAEAHFDTPGRRS